MVKVQCCAFSSLHLEKRFKGSIFVFVFFFVLFEPLNSNSFPNSVMVPGAVKHASQNVLRSCGI